MSVKSGSSAVSKFYTGSSAVSKIQQGANSVYSAESVITYAGSAIFGEFLTQPPHLVPVPAVATDDLRLMFANGNNENSTINNPPVISGWTSLPGTYGLTSTPDMFAWKRVKQAGDTDGNVSVNLSDGGASKSWLGNVITFGFSGGNDPSGNLVISTASVAGNSGGITAPSITAVAGSYVYATIISEENDRTYNAPAGWTTVSTMSALPQTGWTARLFKLTAYQSAGAVVPATFFQYLGGSTGFHHVIWMFALASSVIPVPPTTTFLHTGAAQSFVVPVGVTSLSISAYGAEGGLGANANGTTPGKGGLSVGTLAVTPGETLNIYVGGQNGYNGGGAPGGAAVKYGGGASDVRQGGTALSNRKIVAGGGGGTIDWNIPSVYGNGGNGGGGSSNGANGADGGIYNDTFGYAGTNAAGGAAATGYYNLQAQPGSLGQGGSSGGGGDGAVGGPGGGGYYGGGGGSVSIPGQYHAGGGGGGSGYIGGVTGGTGTTGVRSGNGTVIISWG